MTGVIRPFLGSPGNRQARLPEMENYKHMKNTKKYSEYSETKNKSLSLSSQQYSFFEVLKTILMHTVPNDSYRF